MAGITANNKVYDANANVISFSGTAILSGEISGDAVSLTGTPSGTFNNKNVGTSKPVAVTGFGITGGDAGNYNFTQPTGLAADITPATLTYVATAVSKTYGNANPISFSGTVTGFVGGESEATATTGTRSFATTATQFSNAGQWPITGSGLFAANYVFVQDAGNATAFTINQRPLNFTGTRMYNGSKVFDASILTASNIVNSDPITLGGNGEVSSENVGAYTSFSQNNLTTGNTDYTATGGSVNVTITPQTANPVADAFYTGPSFYWTPNSSSNTATVSLIATLRNNINYTGDIRTAKVSFFIRNADNSTTPITGAQNLPVGLVDPDDNTVGTVAVNVQMSIGNATAGIFNIAVKISGNYTSNLTDPTLDGSFTIAKPTPGGLIVGAGWLKNKTSETLQSSGYVKGAEEKKTRFDYYVQYNKSLKNPQGGVQIVVKSYNDRNGNPTTTLHTYRFKSNAISVLAVVPPSTAVPYYTAQFSGKANVAEVFTDGTEQSIEGNCTMQLDMTDVDPAGGIDDLLAVTIYRSKGGIWFTSAWDGAKPVQTAILNNSQYNSQLSATGSGGASAITASANPRTVDNTVNSSVPATAFVVKVYPNPTTSQFDVKLESSNTIDPIGIVVYGINGNVVEQKQKLTAGQTIQLGALYRPGVYILEMIQGNQRKQLKLVKTPD